MLSQGNRTIGYSVYRLSRVVHTCQLLFVGRQLKLSRTLLVPLTTQAIAIAVQRWSIMLSSHIHSHIRSHSETILHPAGCQYPQLSYSTPASFPNNPLISQGRLACVCEIKHLHERLNSRLNHYQIRPPLPSARHPPQLSNTRKHPAETPVPLRLTPVLARGVDFISRIGYISLNCKRQ